MVAFSLSLKRPRTFTILGFICLILVFMNTSACIQSGKMSTQQAKDIHLKFKETYVNRPPRSLGEHIEYLVKMNSDNPDMEGECGLPEESLSEDDLALISEKFHDTNPWVLQSESNRLFLHGNARHAAVLADIMAKTAPGTDCRVKAGALADKAKYLAIAGDYELAEQSMIEADKCFSIGSGLNSIQLRYELTRAESAVAFARGDLETAEQKLYEALHHLEMESRVSGTSGTSFSFHGRWRQADAMIALSEVMLWQGQRMEAEIWARKAASIPSELTLPPALLILGEILLAEGKTVESQKMARTVLNMLNDHCVTRDAIIRARTHQLFAKIYMEEYKWDSAIKEFDLIRDNLATDDRTFNLRFDGTMEWGLSLIMAGYPDKSILQLDKAYKNAIQRLGQDHYLAFEIRGIRAIALAAKGLKKEALVELNMILDPLIQNWRQIGGESAIQFGRYKRLRLILESYLTLLGEVPQKNNSPMGNIQTGFETAAAIHSLTVATSLAKSVVRFTSKNSEEVNTIRAYQDLEKKLALHLHLLNAYYEKPEKYRNQTIKKQLEGDIKQIKTALDTLASEIKIQSPKYENIIYPGSVSLDKIRSQLNKNEALITFFTGRHHTFVWAVPKHGPIAFTSIKLSLAELSRMVTRIRHSLDPGNVSTIEDIPPFEIGMAIKFYDLFLKPIEAGWKSARDLLVVSDGPLAHMPLSVIPGSPIRSTIKGPPIAYRKVPWMIRTHSITVLPAVSSLQVLRPSLKVTGEQKTFAGFGDPVFNSSQAIEKNETPPSLVAKQYIERRLKPQTRNLFSAGLDKLPRLPETADEVREIANVLEANLDKDVFLRENASEGSVKNSNLNDRKILLFATHGLVPGDLDGLYEPALALSNPVASGDVENDGLLTMGEVMALELNADWVILSACNTAAGDGAGAEAISGLGQAFFYAGARALLVSMWPVETTSAKKLTSGIFTIQKTKPSLSRARLLRESMLDLMDNQFLLDESTGERLSDYAHPMLWAPFVIVGDGS